MATGTPKAVFWIEVLNWEKWNPRRDIKKPSWFRMENDLLDGNPDFDDFSCEELVSWWWILSQCSRAQRGAFKCSLEKWERIRGIPVAKAWGAVEKLIEMGTIRVTDTSRPRDEDDTDTLRGCDGSVTDSSQMGDAGVENALRSRTATNERTDVRDEHGDPNSKNKKTLNSTQLVNKGETLGVGDKSQKSPDNSKAESKQAGEKGGDASDMVTQTLDSLFARGQHKQAIKLIGNHVKLKERYRDFLERYGGAEEAVEEGSP